MSFSWPVLSEFLRSCWENPNGKVRSYYIEQAGEYFKRHGLKPNDRLLIYQEKTGILTNGFERARALQFTTPGPRFREPLHSLIEDVSWVKRPRYSEMFPTWLDETSSSSKLNPSFQ